MAAGWARRHQPSPRTVRAATAGEHRPGVIGYFDLIEWGIAALLSLGATLIALKVFKLAPAWAVVIGIVVLTGLYLPLRTHAVRIEIPQPKSN